MASHRTSALRNACPVKPCESLTTSPQNSIQLVILHKGTLPLKSLKADSPCRMTSRSINHLLIGSLFLIPILAVALIDTDVFMFSDEGVPYITTFFFVPFLILLIRFLSRSLPQNSLLARIWQAFGCAVFAAFCAYLCGIGYFSFWNAVTGNGETVLVSGPVVHMEAGKRGGVFGNPLYITIHHDGQNIKLTVPPEEYAELGLRQTYYRGMKLGGQGYYYNWGSSWWK